MRAGIPGIKKESYFGSYSDNPVKRIDVHSLL